MGYMTLTTILFFFFAVITIARKRNRQDSYATPHHQFMYEEWMRAERDVRAWKHAHPLGPTNEAEHRELEELKLIALGAYYISRMANGLNAIDEHAHHRMNSISDWRF